MSGNGTDVAIRTVDQPLDYAVLEHVLGTGDLGKLSTEQRVAYYRQTCDSLGLNYATRPFRFMSFQGAVVMYATRDCADQLRNIHKISLSVVEQRHENGLYIVTVRATTKEGRSDEDMGAVPLGQSLVGEARANAILKAITKAKRRVTLSICGLGFNDETEIATLPGAVTFDAEDDKPIEPPRSKITPPPPPPRRTARQVLDSLRRDAEAAMTLEDLGSLRDTDEARAILALAEDHPAREQLDEILSAARVRLRALVPNKVDTIDDEISTTLDSDGPDAYASRAARLCDLIRAADTPGAVRDILSVLINRNLMEELYRQNRKDLADMVIAVRNERLAELGGQ